MGLFDMVMIKDNHISAAGGIKNAIRSVDEYLEKRNLQMEVEVIFSLSTLPLDLICLSNLNSGTKFVELINFLILKVF